MTSAVTLIGKQSQARWLTTALFASLALNLIVIGATAGFVWRHGLPESGDAPYLAPNLLNYASTLPPERHKELLARTEEERRNVRPLRRELREVRDESLKLLVAEPFDKQRYQDVQARLLAADQKAREAVHKLYGEIAASLTPEERRGFLRWREKRRPMQNLLDEPDKQAKDRK